MPGPVESIRKFGVDFSLGNTETFLGVKPTSFKVIQKVAIRSKQRLEDVCLTIRKIRMNEDWDTMAELYGYDRDTVRSTFTNTLAKITPHLGGLLPWKGHDGVPEVFKRCGFSDIYAVARCMEVNGKKYLISYYPSGVVRDVAQGEPAELSNDEVVACSGYTFMVPHDRKVMVTDDFGELKSVEGCRLPEIPARKRNPTKEDLELVRNIISLRVHVLTMLKRIEKFQLCMTKSDLAPELMDSVFMCAAGLSNIK